MSAPLVPAVADRPLLAACWSLGWASSATVAGLAAPQRPAAAVERRLRQLARAGYLRQLRLLAGPAGHRLLYTPGRFAGRVDPGLVGGWRPPLAAVEHTVAVGRSLLAAHHGALPPPVRVTGWRGEAELRAWHLPGEPLPDATLSWAAPGRRGRFYLEVDRGTEGRSAWERKLAGYLISEPGRWSSADTILAIAPGAARCRRLAQLAGEAGVPLLAVPETEWYAPPAGGVVVFSAVHRRRLEFGHALAGG